MYKFLASLAPIRGVSTPPPLRSGCARDPVQARRPERPHELEETPIAAI